LFRQRSSPVKEEKESAMPPICNASSPETTEQKREKLVQVEKEMIKKEEDGTELDAGDLSKAFALQKLPFLLRIRNMRSG
jgi:hypothetical protein